MTATKHVLKTILLLTVLPELTINSFDVHHFSLSDEQTNIRVDEQTDTQTDTLDNLLNSSLTDSEYLYGRMRSTFGVSPWLGKELAYNNLTLDRNGRKLGSSKGARVWPNARVPYEFSDTIDFMEWNTMQTVFTNISSVTNIKFVPRTAQDSDYLLITEDIETYGCGCCSIGLGYLAGSGAHVLVLAPVANGGCGVNHIGGTHEMLHILGLAHTQNRPDRCNYIDVRTDLLTGWGEWGVAQISGATDWFSLRIPYDCSSYVHYYQLQGAFWKKEVEEQVDQFMERQGCENSQRGKFINKCLVDGGHTEGSRVVKEGYDLCLDKWGAKHKKCVEKVIKRFPTFKPVDPNGRCKANGVNKSKRKSHEISQWDIWALNVAYGGPLPPCQYKNKVGDGVCDVGNNNVGCDYDGGDCCLPQANDRDCIDPCGVRLKFFGGRNRPCRKAPVTSEFCNDHYWYGDNKCGQEYCRQTDEKYLQWQCKQTCGLCNTDPSQKEMDQICNSYIPPNQRDKYQKKTNLNKKVHNAPKVANNKKNTKQPKPKQERPTKNKGSTQKTKTQKKSQISTLKEKFVGKSKPSKQNSTFTSNNLKSSTRKLSGKTKQLNEIKEAKKENNSIQTKLKQERPTKFKESIKKTAVQKSTQTTKENFFGKSKPSKQNSIVSSNNPKSSIRKFTGKTKQVNERPRSSGKSKTSKQNSTFTQNNLKSTTRKLNGKTKQLNEIKEAKKENNSIQTKLKQKRPTKVKESTMKTTVQKNTQTTKEKFVGKSEPSKQNSIVSSNNPKSSTRKLTGKTKQVNERPRSSGKSKPFKQNSIFTSNNLKSSTSKLDGKTKRVNNIPQTSGGFQVVQSADRRKQLRSYWSRRG